MFLQQLKIAGWAMFLILFFLAATATAAVAELPPRGTITLDFSDSATDAVRYRYTPAAGLPEAVDDEFAEGSGRDAGKFTYLSGSSVLSFTAGNNCSTVGFTDNKDWIGCFKKGGIGTGKIADRQTLLISLDQVRFADAIASDWIFRFTGKQNVVFDMVLDYFDGSDARTLTVYSGTEAVAALARGLLPNERACSPEPDSSPDSEASCEITGNEPFQTIELAVTNDGELSIGSQDSVINLAAFTGTLTCEEDDPALTTTVEEFFEAGGGVQCRRLPNRDGTQCEVVPYLLDASCDASGGCQIEFVHGDQPTIPVAREEYAFLCEVWWPEREGGTGTNPDGQLTGPILPKTEIFWGGDGTTPPVTGDVPVDYCAGVTPLFSAPQLLEPNGSTNCGTSVAYLLSEPAIPGPVVNGGTVAPASTDCSLLEAYDDVLIPAGFPDQCDADAGCPVGRQIACLIDSRFSQIEDPEAICTGTPGDCSSRDPSDPGDVTSATSLYKNFELIFFQGDLQMRRL